MVSARVPSHFNWLLLPEEQGLRIAVILGRAFDCLEYRLFVRNGIPEDGR